MDKVTSLKNVTRPPVCPRDHFAVIGEKFYAVPGDTEVLKQYKDTLSIIDRQNIVIDPRPNQRISTAFIVRIGKDIWWDTEERFNKPFIEKYKRIWEEEGFRVHLSNRGYHVDSSFCVVKPGCIVSLQDVQDHQTQFPGWEVLYLPDQSWSMVDPFMQIKNKVGGRWWLKGEEHNDQLIEFVNTWLNDWVGYVEETVFDVNMLSLDHNTIICNNHNKEVFTYFKKHKVEPVIFNFRHRYFWDGGVHCITQDLYREGTQEDYFG